MDCGPCAEGAREASAAILAFTTPQNPSSGAPFHPTGRSLQTRCSASRKVPAPVSAISADLRGSPEGIEVLWYRGFWPKEAMLASKVHKQRLDSPEVAFLATPPKVRDLAAVDVMTRDEELAPRSASSPCARPTGSSILSYPPFIDGICDLARELLSAETCPGDALDAMKPGLAQPSATATSWSTRRPTRPPASASPSPSPRPTSTASSRTACSPTSAASRPA
jgi:hypothetical protein